MHCARLRQTRRPIGFRGESEFSRLQSREREESLLMRTTLERIEEEDEERSFARKMEAYDLDNLINLKYGCLKVISRTPRRFGDAPPNELMSPPELLRFVREFPAIEIALVHHQTSR